MKRLGKICIMMLVGILMATMLTASVTASPWSQGGNNIGSATAMGSTDNYDVYFITGNTEAMRIDTNQRIGIADSTPDFRLEVAGTSGSGYFGVSSSAGMDGNLFIIDSSGDVGIGTTNPSNKLTVSGDADFTGSVGIGTTSPSYKLDVKAWSVVGPCTFEGEIQDDMTPGGTYLGSEDLTYVVEIDGTGTPDTFKWSDDGGSTWDATGVAITGSAQSLNYGVTVTFGATTGHTLGDKWSFETRVTNPFSVQNAAGDQVFSVNNDGSFGINMTPTDSEYVLEVGGDIWFNSSIVKFGSTSLSTHSDDDKNSYMGTQFVRIIFDADNSANDYYFAVGVHEDKRKNTPAYATSERFWIREDGKTGIGAQSPLGRLWVNTEPTTGEGTIETLGTDVTGTSTLFEDELMIGSEIWIEVSHGPKPWDQQKEIRRVVAIISDTEIDIDSEFSQDIPSGTNFKYSRPILCVENNERVGISTISPTESLDVNGRVRVRTLDAGQPADTIVVADSTGVLRDSEKTIDDLEDDDWYEVGTTDPPDDIDDNIWTYGNVSIGTPTPNHKLHISDTDTTANRAGLYVVQSGAISGTGYGLYVNKTGASTANVAGYFSATGATNNYGLIVENGNVGIGTTNPDPGAKLEVAGQIKITGGSPGQGKVLTSDANGLASWQAVTQQNLFEKIDAPSGTDPIADSPTDILYLAQGGIVTITGDAGTDTITISATEVDGSTTNELQNIWATINSDSGSTTANIQADTLTISGSGIASTSISDDTLTITATEVDGSTTNELPLAGNDIDVTGTPARTVALEDDIDVSIIRASTGNGLTLYDDNSNLGIFIEDEGNVGIGTASPSHELHVAGSARIDDWLYVADNNGEGIRFLEEPLLSAAFDNMDIRLNTDGLDDDSSFDIYNVSTRVVRLEFGSGADSYIIPSGHFGIGTRNPTSPLQVIGLTVYTSNQLAINGGLTAGAFYRSNSDPSYVCVVY